MRVEAPKPQISETAYQFNKRHTHPPAHRWLIEDNGSTVIGLCKRDGCGKRKRFVSAIEDLPDYREPSASKRDRTPRRTRSNSRTSLPSLSLIDDHG